MEITLQLKNLDATIAKFKGYASKVADAQAYTLNTLAYETRKRTNALMSAVFQGGATPYTLKALYVDKATGKTLRARVALSKEKPLKGTVWYDALAHEFRGGRRKFRRFEGALLRANLMPPGMIAVPGKACPLDGFGNIRPSFITQLLSYFQAFDKAGHKANMTAKRIAKLANRGKTAGGYSAINGVEYFVSYKGRGKPGGDRFTHGRFSQHLPAGIWQRSGIHGRDVKPVVMFVKGGSYRAKVDLGGIARQVVAERFNSVFAAALRFAVRGPR